MFKKTIIIALLVALFSCHASATLYSIPTPVTTTEMTSSVAYDEEYLTVKTPEDEPRTIYVEGKVSEKVTRFCLRISDHLEDDTNYYVTTFVTPDENGAFSIKIDTTEGNKEVPAVIDGKGTVAEGLGSVCYDTKPGYNPIVEIPAGFYHMSIACVTTEKDANIAPGSKWYSGPLGGHNGYTFDSILFQVTEGDENNLRLVKYPKAITNNQKVSDAYEVSSQKDGYYRTSYEGSHVRYLDDNLKDIRFVLKDPATGKYSDMTTYRKNYMATRANNITANCDTDYEKVHEIYEYVTSNFYYDNLAFKAGKNQYAHPFLNIYNMRNKINTANSKDGKVATTCQGFAAMVVALARAEDIPARLVRGHHITPRYEIWSDIPKSIISDDTHWWAEVYVDGRWVFVDATTGCQNTWERKSSFSEAGTWKEKPMNNQGFDMSPEMLGNHYIYNSIYKGSSDGKYANVKSEVGQLQNFLNYKYSGTKNGTRLNSKYSSTNLATWTNGKSDNFTTDGFGQVSNIIWPGEGFRGTMNLSNFDKLEYLTVYDNKISKINVSGCDSLTYLSANYNNLTSFDGSGAKALEDIRLKGNKLTSVKFYHKGNLVTFKRNISVGSFGFTYDKNKSSKKVTIYAADPPKGYKYLGIYKNGSRISKYQTHSFTPTSGTYYVKYAKK